MGRIRKDSWILSVEYHEGALLGCAMNSVIMREFGKREPITPVCLSVIDEDSKILFDLLVNSFSLSISLWVEGCGRVRCDVKHSV